MRLMLFAVAFLVAGLATVKAQSVTDNIPPFTGVVDDRVERSVSGVELPDPTDTSPEVVDDPYTVSNVHIDVTAATAAQARDQALLQAQRLAYVQLCVRMNVPNNADRFSDDDIAALIQSFDVQSERLSAVRYIGVFSIHFNPAAVQKAMALPLSEDGETPSVPTLPPFAAWPQTAPSPSVSDPRTMNNAPYASEPNYGEPVLQIPVRVKASSLAAWIQIKHRIEAINQVVKADMQSLGRGTVLVELSYRGSVEALIFAAQGQGLFLRQGYDGSYDLYDNAMGTP